MRSFSFGGCGWAVAWPLGFALKLSKLDHQITKSKVAGASGGSLVAATLALGLDQKDAFLLLRTKARELSNTGGFFGRTGDALQSVLEEMLPNNESYKKLSKQLYVSVSSSEKLTIKNLLVSEFDSKQDLRDALYASCFIPWYMVPGKAFFKYKDIRCFDGGFTNNSPILDRNTFIISPFPSVPVIMEVFDVCPFKTNGFSPLPISLRELTKNAFSPDLAVLDMLFQHGQTAATEFYKLNPKTPAWLDTK